MSEIDKYYFHDGTERAIVKYNEKITICCSSDYTTHTNIDENTGEERIYWSCNKCNKIVDEKDLKHKLSDIERGNLYRQEIEFPFLKLAESIIHTFKLYNFDLSPERMKGDVVSFLIMKLHRFDHTKGFKAYSFFGKVAKNYLIQTSIKNTRRKRMHLSIDSLDSPNRDQILYQIDKRIDKNYDESSQGILIDILSRTVEHIKVNIDKYFKKEMDKKIVWGIIKIIEDHRDLVENYNKKALYILLREYSSESTIRISRVLKKVRLIYERIKKERYMEL